MAQTDESAALQDLVRGRLSQEEATRLNRAINADPALEAEHRLVAALNETDLASHAFPGEFGWARLSRAIDRKPARRPWGQTVTLWQAAACIAVAVLVWQFTVAPRLLGDPAGPARYETATGTGGPVEAGATIRVAFAPAATEGVITTLLREAGARIVDGPSAIGLYTLAFDDDEARAAGLERLAVSPSVVTPVDAE